MAKVTRWVGFALVCVMVIGVAATAATARTTILRATTRATPPIRTALYDPIFRTSRRSRAFVMAARAGATYARISVSWKSVAPRTLPPSGFDPTDPASPYYRWSSLDATVTAAAARGIQLILDIVGPPSWAYNVAPGTWTGGDPQINALGEFATALARRYDGSGPAPAVHAFSVWNEPNFNRNLYPQDPTYYRSMVNAVADSVHAVNPANLVLAGELAPFKHPPTPTDKNNVIPPIAFMQQMLCISRTKPYHRTCHKQAKFDVWTHHPYSDNGPYGHATGSGGVELGDLTTMNKLLQTAKSLGAISSAHPPQFWVTEFGWSSNPPNLHAAPIKLEARWMSESLYQMWKSGVTLGTWFLLQDMPTRTPFQSGLYFKSSILSKAVAKPLLAPFAFPFVAYLRSGGKVKMWGRDATSDVQDVAIRSNVRGTWKTLAIIRSNKHGIFAATLGLNAASTWTLQASAGGVKSAPFSLTAPPNENMRVVPFPRN